MQKFDDFNNKTKMNASEKKILKHIEIKKAMSLLNLLTWTAQLLMAKEILYSIIKNGNFGYVICSVKKQKGLLGRHNPQQFEVAASEKQEHLRRWNSEGGVTLTIESFDAVFYTCIFLIPGYIIKSILDIMVPPVRHNDTKFFLSCLCYSILNCAAWSWAYILVSAVANTHPVKYWFLLLTVTVIGAFVIAFIFGIFRQKNLISRLFQCLGINISHSIPTAWDYYFSKQQINWIIVTLKNGKTICGLFSDKSFASSDPEERDLYIEKIYTLGPEKQWNEVKRSEGILVSKDEIETIEFFNK